MRLPGRVLTAAKVCERLDDVRQLVCPEGGVDEHLIVAIVVVARLHMQHLRDCIWREDTVPWALDRAEAQSSGGGGAASRVVLWLSGRVAAAINAWCAIWLALRPLRAMHMHRSIGA